MIFKTNDGPGARASATGAECDWFDATSQLGTSPADLRAQRLVRLHSVQPGLAPIVAALAWGRVTA